MNRHHLTRIPFVAITALPRRGHPRAALRSTGGIFGNSAPAHLGSHRNLRHPRRRRPRLGELHRRVRPRDPGGLIPSLLADGPGPPPTAIMTYGPNQVLSNAAIVPLGPGEQMESQRQRKHAHHHGRQRLLRPQSFEVGIPFQWETSNSGTFGAGIITNSRSTSATPPLRSPGCPPTRTTCSGLSGSWPGPATSPATSTAPSPRAERAFRVGGRMRGGTMPSAGGGAGWALAVAAFEPARWRRRAR